MKFASSFAVLGALASIASAFVSPTAPIGATIWKPNTVVTITWVDDSEKPSLSTKPVFDISFMTGGNLQMIKLATIATNVTGGDTSSYNWTVPYVSPPGQIYFLQFDTVAGTNPSAVAWSTRFTITDANGNAPAAPSSTNGGNGTIIAAPTTAAASGAAATATGSGSNPSATAAGKNGAGSLAASAMTVAAAVGAAALMAL